MTLTSDFSTSDPSGRDTPRSEVVLGEDWEKPEIVVEQELRAARDRRSVFALNRSPLARKIILFNLLGIVVLVAGMLYLNPFRDSLVLQRERALAFKAQLIADVLEERIASFGGTIDPSRADQALARIGLAEGLFVHIFAPDGTVLSSSSDISVNPARPVQGLVERPERIMWITDFLNRLWDYTADLITRDTGGAAPLDVQAQAQALIPEALSGATVLSRGQSPDGAIYLAVSAVDGSAGIAAVVAVSTAAGEVDDLVRAEREQLLQFFVVALLISIVLSLVLASTIANPLSDLADAAELGRDKNARKLSPTRVRIPDLTGRPDEIGRLSAALRGMVGALYDRIESNEQFAADVSHEIKNPLASLRSAVSTLQRANTDDQRSRLYEVITHDVQRLDRLVSDISNASRLDADLVKEEEEEFDLLRTLRNICDYHAGEARAKDVSFITDLPDAPILITGLEGRLAQVFVNLLSNALSFCDAGDAVRIWARKREDRILVVVEDTGPGIPDDALTKVFTRFYSERPQAQFGNHSGLGLAISKQIVEAHGGVIWAENIRPTEADVTSDPLGARFIVGLPI
ncbi:sensor histidine kinase [Roseovarius sp. 10]|jgi:two-component system sensor histidine kinase ChvG|uniref:sensor histidine kinase n=1 Tax=Roseovarius sp. 10 TaxID=3080563 RepID=UPI0029536B4C|nr:sensor histidine kinase [Roseovarius sp. 10]MDV7202231.1 sensor histidine kinase [Roseovarius sp. 10]